ncbi:MAG: substrate-binding domain-containing protein [Planctomycetes bacterium]|nr:substrate-binding domain-containing protein [Planctomycetota bacterium]
MFSIARSPYGLLLAAAVGLVGLAACEPSAGRSDRQGVEGTLAVVGAGRSHVLWPVLRNAAARFQAIHPRFRVLAEAPPVVSPNLQEKLIRRLCSDGVRGVCVQVTDARALAGLLESLRSEGIVVVTLFDPVESTDPFPHSGVDYRAEGNRLADALASCIPDGGTVGVLGAEADRPARLRQSGFNRRRVSHPELTVLHELDCAGDDARAVGLVRDTMKRFPGIDGWAAMDTWSLLAPNDGQALLPPKCSLVLPGPVADAVQALRDGRCQAMVVADYHEIVTRALQVCVLSLQGQPVLRPTFEAEVRIVTTSNLAPFARDWARWTAWPIDGAEQEGAGP